MLRFRCQTCGQKIKLPLEYAGQRVRCPKCKEPCRIPDAPQEDVAKESSGLDELAAMESNATAGHAAASGPTCPSCGVGVSSQAAICVGCGYSFQSKKQMKTQTRQASAMPDVGQVAGAAGRAAGSTATTMIGGCIVAGICGVVWAAIARFTGYEIGWGAIILGCVVGASIAAFQEGESGSSGILAVMFALLALGSGKVLIANWALPAIIAKDVVEYSGDAETTYGMAAMLEAWEGGGITQQQVDAFWSDETSDAQAEQIVVKAVIWYENNTPAQEPDVSQLGTLVEKSYKAVSFQQRLKDSMDYMDALWVLLALGAAYKTGAGAIE